MLITQDIAFLRKLSISLIQAFFRSLKCSVSLFSTIRSVSNLLTSEIARMYMSTLMILPLSSWTNSSKWTCNYHHKECTVSEKESTNSVSAKVLGPCGPEEPIVLMMMEKEGSKSMESIHLFSSRARRREISSVCGSETQMLNHHSLSSIKQLEVLL